MQAPGGLRRHFPKLSEAVHNGRSAKRASHFRLPTPIMNDKGRCRSHPNIAQRRGPDRAPSSAKLAFGRVHSEKGRLWRSRSNWLAARTADHSIQLDGLPALRESAASTLPRYGVVGNTYR